jgi:hypothetical protein
MRVNQLQFDTAYATCNGRYVKVVDVGDGLTKPVLRRAWSYDPVLNRTTINNTYPPHDGTLDDLRPWCFTDEDTRPTHYTRWSLKEPVLEYVPKGQVTEATDPWGKCITRNAPSNTRDDNLVFRDGVWWYRAPDRYGYSTGILVDYYTVDEDGEVITKIPPKRGLMAAKDIPGTWLEYMSLHAEDVRVRGEQERRTRDADRIVAAARRKIVAVTKMPSVDTGGGAFGNKVQPNATVSMQYSLNGGYNHGEPETYHLEIKLTGKRALDYARNTLRLPGLKHATVTEQGNIKIP